MVVSKIVLTMYSIKVESINGAFKGDTNYILKTQ